MTGMNYDDYHDETASPVATGGVQSLVTWAGALTSVVLVIGLGVWAYQLTMRDVSGVPVVRAIEGPSRIAPEEPGGRQADHQGLAVNRVAAHGEAAPPADRLALAPRPVDLTAEDAPRAALRPEPRVVQALPEETPAEPAPVAVALTQETEAPADPVADAIAEQIAAPVEELVETPLVADDLVAEETEAETETAVLVGRSVYPRARPDTDLAVLAALNAAAQYTRPAVAAAAAPVVATATAPVELDTTALAPGTNLVQLGAFDTPDVARAEWQRLSTRFSSLMQGKQRVVQSAVSGGRTFYRLRAVGFADISDARRFCAVLTAENTDCIPVVAR
ncbi:SPOR domain-containing protein [Actibacterium sp. XHP0104]|uniref:SPOR domain-containing protein n=1 Tax=Actibacterium sp. XHP0104 TaxID=2984335 RepID=UPI0021E8DE22|nr:SPOR domain-containing protein [Actibacterium sp. XHP0104]MCV2881209.1 SPOR domain-containing protein [Actibacterium sp. XHP0104]